MPTLQPALVKSPSSFTPVRNGHLQCKCACGGAAGPTGECEGCRKKKLQRKLTIGASNDPEEMEADRTADRVLAAPMHSEIKTAPHICLHAGQTSGQMETAPASVERVLASSGRPLDQALQDDMEQRFGYDFSRVRVHLGAAAEQSARDVNANAYTVRHNIVFGADRFAPATHEGRRLIAHELAHVVQQSGADGIRSGHSHEKSDLAPLSPILYASLQRTEADNQAQPKPDMMRIYSFGPTGAGRMAMHSGMTIFTPAAQVDVKGNELVRAGTIAEPVLFRFGRYFTLDERHRPYPPPVPSCSVKVMTEWMPDDGSASSKDQKEDSATWYYQPGEPLVTKLRTEYVFPNDRPGVLTLGYVFDNPDLSFLLLVHGVRFVDDPAAPRGATVLPEQMRGQGLGAVAPPEAKAADAPSKAADGAPEKKPEAKGTSLPPSPAAQTPPLTAVGQIKELTELIKKTSDAATKDTLIRKLRDLLSGLQPFIPAKNAKQIIDDAIRSFVKDKADEAIMAILKAIAGKSPTTMPDNRNQTGPDVPQKDLGENIFQGPKIPIKDAPAPPPRFSFQYRNGPQRSYEVGASIRFTLVPPDNFSALQGMKRLVIVAEADRNTPNPERFARIDLESASPKQIELQAPLKPGKYVIRIDIGLGFDYSNMQELEVRPHEGK